MQYPDLTGIAKLQDSMSDFLKQAFPLCRSLTGKDTIKTLEMIQKNIPLELVNVVSGTKVFDWVVPEEWTIRDAYVKDPMGNKIVDFKKSNLSVVNYSPPIHTTVSLQQLKEHLYTLPEFPEWTPYRTSYYKKEWGFCMPYQIYKTLQEGAYEVYIDSDLKPSSLVYGEYCIQGRDTSEYLFSTYICHPSLGNDNLSGVALQMFLAQELSQISLSHTYRFIFIPETIGSLTWLANNKDRLSQIRGGLVITCVGDAGTLTYKKSRNDSAYINKITSKVLHDSGRPHTILDFFPIGSDERQYCSPGFNLPMGSLMRTPYGRYEEYHTSADNLSFIHPSNILDTLYHYLLIIYTIEHDGIYVNTNPYGEPHLGKRGLYSSIGGNIGKEETNAFLWILNLSDGKHSLLDIATHSKLNFHIIKEAADQLLEVGLLKRSSIAPSSQGVENT